MSEHQAKGVSSASSSEGRTPQNSWPPRVGRSVDDPAERARVFGALFPADADPVKVGRFELRRRLGQGGMGTVYEAVDDQLERRVAIKVTRDWLSPQLQQRFVREAQALARLSHPNVVQIYEVGELDGGLFIAMEHIDGQTLSAWQQRPRPWTECLEVYLQAGRGLQAAHDHGLVHRDFKPANCIMDTQGRVRVLDFGLARDANALTTDELDEGTTEEQRRSGSALLTTLTEAGSVLGTIAYMAPEQQMGRQADELSDQFSFCVALFEALFGQRPFESSTPMARLLSMLDPHIPSLCTPPGLPSVPTWLRRLVVKGLSTEPANRHSQLGILLDALEHTRRRRRRTRAMMGVAAATTLAAIGTAAWPSPGPCEGMREESMPQWGPQARAAVHDGLLGTDLNHAERTWKVIDEQLSRHADAWSEQRAAACEDTHERRVQGTGTYDLQLLCLDRQARKVGALVERLSVADHSVLDHAIEAAQALPSPRRCADTQQLQGGPSAPSAEQADAVRRVQEQIDEAEALQHTGALQQGLEVALEAVGWARASGHDPTLAESLMLTGSLQLRSQTNEVARASLREAMVVGERSDHDEVATHATLSLAWASAYDGEVSGSRAWSEVARAKLEALDPLPKSRAAGLVELGQAAYWRRDLEEAADLVRRGYGLLAESASGHELLLADASLVLAAVEEELGEVEAAREHYTHALSLHRQWLGEDHPTTGRPLRNLGSFHLALGETDAAKAALTRALGIAVKTHGEAHPVVIETHLALAQLRALEGELALASEHASRAFALLEGPPEVDVPRDLRVRLLTLRATLAQREGAIDRARAGYERARTLVASGDEPDVPHVAELDNNIAECLVATGQYVEAIELLGSVLEVFDAHHGPDHVFNAYPLRALGEAELGLGRPEAAVEPLRRALSLMQRFPGDQPHLAGIYWALAKAMDALDGTDEALEFSQRAHEIYAALGEQGRGPLAEIEQWITTRSTRAK